MQLSNELKEAPSGKKSPVLSLSSLRLSIQAKGKSTGSIKTVAMVSPSTKESSSSKSQSIASERGTSRGSLSSPKSFVSLSNFNFFSAFKTKSVKSLLPASGLRLIVLGPANAGKSTLSRQILQFFTKRQAHFETPFPDLSPARLQLILVHNIYQEAKKMAALAIAGPDGADAKAILPTDEEWQKLAKQLPPLNADPPANWPTELLAELLTTVNTLKALASHQNLLYHSTVSDAAEYLFYHADRILKIPFTATDEDKWQVRIDAGDVTEHRFTTVMTQAASLPPSSPQAVSSEEDLEKVKLQLFDMSGKRHARAKWSKTITPPDGSDANTKTALLFIVPLSAFDAKCGGERDANAMEDARLLWDGIVNNRKFAHMPIVLIFTKADIVQRKIAFHAVEAMAQPDMEFSKSVAKHFPDFAAFHTAHQTTAPGEMDLDSDFRTFAHYFREKFVKQIVNLSLGMTLGHVSTDFERVPCRRTGAVYLHQLVAIDEQKCRQFCRGLEGILTRLARS